MNILVTGRGTSGSWRIRGEQLGAAIGATVEARATTAKGFDIAILVKRAESPLIERLQRSGARIVWDIVDAWPQPEANLWSREACMAWLRSQVERIRPAAIVAATKAMAEDCAEFRLPVLTLPHHARPNLERNPIREHVEMVAYEGSERYIARWRCQVEEACAARGWRFVVNPQRLADADIVLALRDCAGYAPRRWKSNVKLANAQGSGTPFIGCREAGYLELAVGTCERWADTPSELARAFDELTPAAERRRAAGWMHAAAPRLEAVAGIYSQWLKTTL